MALDARPHRWTVAWLAAAALLPAPSPASAQQWAAKMFDHTSHDFGVVARGAEVEHTFTIENIYEEPAHVASIRSSCGCTNTQLSRHDLASWEKAELTVRVDTRNFLRQKDATITVVFDQPFAAEVQLQVHCYIRSDVVVEPGAVQFGSVRQGQQRERDLTISYAGHNDWQIEQVRCTNKHIDVTLEELGRHGGQVTYALAVRLQPDAPVGYLNDTVTLVTNDENPRAAAVPIKVEGQVTPAVTVRPSPLMLGVLKPGDSVTRQVVIHGKSPFHVLAAASDDARITASHSDQEKALHVIPVTFTAGRETGQSSSELRITTDAPGAEQLSVTVQAMVVPVRQSGGASQ